MPIIKIAAIDKGKDYPIIKLPAYAHEGDAGMDLYAALSQPLKCEPQETTAVPTGLRVELPRAPEGVDWVWQLEVRSRSGLALKETVSVANSPGTIDQGFRGEIKVLLLNSGYEDYWVRPGDRIAQLVLTRAYRVQWQEVIKLSETARGEGGFGSTGK